MFNSYRVFVNYCGPNVFDIWLQSVAESTWKILKFDWKFAGELLEFSSSKTVGTLK